MSNTKNALYFRNLDPHVKHQFKSVCVRRGECMQDVVEALMRVYITNPNTTPHTVLKKVRDGRVKRSERRGK